MTYFFVCHCVILNDSEESHRTIDKPNILSLRAVGAAIRWSKVRGICSVDLHPPGSLLRRYASSQRQ